MEITFKNIQVTGKPPFPINIIGYDEAHAIADVNFDSVTLNGKPLEEKMIQSNDYVKRLTVSP